MSMVRIDPQPVWRGHAPTRITNVVGGFIDNAGKQHEAPAPMDMAVLIGDTWYWARRDDPLGGSVKQTREAAAG